jgi:L-lactate dehydrogenase complex protein LldE
LNIAGRLRREGRRIKARHIAEVLTGASDAPAIGEARD